MVVSAPQQLGKRCKRTTPRGLIEKIRNGHAKLPYFVHIGATWLGNYGSARFLRLKAASAIAGRIPDSGLERA
jgi:hypothetical protein